MKKLLILSTLLLCLTASNKTFSAEKEKRYRYIQSGTQHVIAESDITIDQLKQLLQLNNFDSCSFYNKWKGQFVKEDCFKKDNDFLNFNNIQKDLSTITSKPNKPESFYILRIKDVNNQKPDDNTTNNIEKIDIKNDTQASSKLAEALNPNLSNQEESIKEYRGIEVYENSDKDDTLPEYVISESGITLNQTIKWLKTINKISGYFKLFNSSANSSNPYNYFYDFREKFPNNFQKKNYLFNEKKIDTFIKKATEKFEKEKNLLSKPSQGKLYVLRIVRIDNTTNKVVAIPFDSLTTPIKQIKNALTKDPSDLIKAKKTQEKNLPNGNTSNKSDAPKPLNTNNIDKENNKQKEPKLIPTNIGMDPNNSFYTIEKRGDNTNTNNDEIQDGNNGEELGDKTNTNNREKPSGKANKYFNKFNFGVFVIVVLIVVAVAAFIPKGKKSSNENKDQ